MNVANAAKLCDERGISWVLRWTADGPGANGRLAFEVTVDKSDGVRMVYSLPIQGANLGNAELAQLNGDVLVSVLRTAAPKQLPRPGNGLGNGEPKRG